MWRAQSAGLRDQSRDAEEGSPRMSRRDVGAERLHVAGDQAHCKVNRNKGHDEDGFVDVKIVRER